MAAALFRHIDNAGGDGILRASDVDRLAIQHQLPGRRLCDAEQRLAKLGAPGADQAIDTQNFTPPQIEGNVVEFGRMTIIPDGQKGRADFYVEFRKDVMHVTSYHQAHDFGLRCLLQPPLAHSLAITENYKVLSNLIDFVELVADEEDCLALPLQAFDDAEEIIDFLAR